MVSKVLLKNISLIPEEEYQEKVLRVITDEKIAHMTRANGAYAYVNRKTDQVVIMSGITSLLKDIFWYELNMNKLKKEMNQEKKNNNNNDITKSGIITSSGKFQSDEEIARMYALQLQLEIARQTPYLDDNEKKFRKNPFTAKIMGLEKGERIHDQIKKVTQFGLKGFLELQGPDQCEKCVKFLFEKMDNDWSWIPLCSEFIVYDMYHRLATAIDLLVYDKQEKVITLVEIKTGYEGFFEKGTSSMKCGLGWVNSPLNQSKVQLIATSILFERLFPYLKDMQLYVVHIPHERSLPTRYNVTVDEVKRNSGIIAKRMFSEIDKRRKMKANGAKK